jgi:hypothetical protein
MYLNEYIPKDYTFKLNYNKYNKKFFNRLNYNFNKEIITNFIIKQIDFINRIDVKERLILRDYVHGYTFFGIITKYENGNLTLNDIVKTIKDRGLPNKYPPFVYILDKVLREHGSSLVDPDPNKIKLELIDILYDKGYKLQNAISFDIWKETLDLYMKELTEIFTKAPKTEDEIVLYRGAGLNYIGPGAKKGFYTLNRFTSATMDSNVALKYADKYDRDKALIYRITIPKGIPLIFVEPFNEGVKELVEVLIPKGCIFYIERGIKQIDIYDDRKNICPLKSRTVKILDIRLVSYIPPSE